MRGSRGIWRAPYLISAKPGVSSRMLSSIIGNSGPVYGKRARVHEIKADTPTGIRAMELEDFSIDPAVELCEGQILIEVSIIPTP